jgi:hypothetical protein
MKYRIAAFAVLLFATLFILLEWVYKYHFFYIEQNGLFLLTGHYFRETVAAPGGPSSWVGAFLVQLFALPYAGAAVNALLMTGAGVMTALICRRIAPRVPLYLLWALPAVALLCIHFDFNYLYGGTVAFLGMQAALYLYICLPRLRDRLVAGAILVPALFWWGGSVAALFALCAVVWEAVGRVPRWYLSFVVVAEMALIAAASIHFSVFGNWDLVLTPELYLPFRMVPREELWFAWASMPVVIAGAWLFRKMKTLSVKKEAIFTGVQLLLALAAVRAATATYLSEREYKLKELSYHVRNEDWDSVMEISRGTMDNYMYLNYLNLALSEKGVLADDLFRYDQRGPDGLFVPWNGTVPSAVALSEIHFRIGNIAVSQKMAFVGNVLVTPGYGSPRTLMRLVQTNLVFGFYPVAEKYIRILEQTMFYREWARDHRRFLYNDEAVEADPLLGRKRRGLPTEENYVSSDRKYSDLELLALQNPADKTAIEYLGSLMLVSKDMSSFLTLVEAYFDTDLLPTLPRSFQEAVISIWENNPEVWRQYRVEQATIDRFTEFRRQVLAGRSSNSLAGTLRRSFGDTFWYYYMFKQSADAQ